MIGLLARLAVSLGLPARFARHVAVILLALLCLVLIALAKVAYDRSLIVRHDAGKAVAQAQADRAADAGAATRRRTDDARLEAEADALEKVTQDAINADPRVARRAYYDCVSVQQQARRAGRLAPAC